MTRNSIVAILLGAATALVLSCGGEDTVGGGCGWESIYDIGYDDAVRYQGNMDYTARKLMIVAHPDDESIFGGNTLINEPNSWMVLVATNGSNYVRRTELHSAMSSIGTAWEIWDHEDCMDTEHPLGTQFHPGFKEDLEDVLIRGNFESILTHNKEGEYGHNQHQGLSRIVTEMGKKLNLPVCTFGAASHPLPGTDLAIKMNLFSNYSEEFGHSQPAFYKNMDYFTHECRDHCECNTF